MNNQSIILLERNCSAVLSKVLMVTKPSSNLSNISFAEIILSTLTTNCNRLISIIVTFYCWTWELFVMCRRGMGEETQAGVLDSKLLICAMSSVQARRLDHRLKRSTAL